jgi:hypothetical protein
VAYLYQSIDRSNYAPVRETIGAATMRRFGIPAARPLDPNEDVCGRCGFIRSEGTSATNAHDELCDLGVEPCDGFTGGNAWGDCAVCGWKLESHPMR